MDASPNSNIRLESYIEESKQERESYMEESKQELHRANHLVQNISENISANISENVNENDNRVSISRPMQYELYKKSLMKPEDTMFDRPESPENKNSAFKSSFKYL